MQPVIRSLSPFRHLLALCGGFPSCAPRGALGTRTAAINRKCAPFIQNSLKARNGDWLENTGSVVGWGCFSLHSMPDEALIVRALSFVTLAGDLFIVCYFVLSLIETFIIRRPTMLSRLLSQWGLLILFFVAGTASLRSLTFSEVLGWEPCKDCWFQRVFMYSQAPLLAFAFLRRDRGIAPYAILLSLVGMVFSINQYVGQIRSILLPALAGTCEDPLVDCSVSQIFQFGYITIPMMAFTAFAMIALVAWAMIRQRPRSA